jgi:uncharacterized protein YcbK (DUF882 family)
MKAHLENLVEPLRTYLGKPLKILSAWRPPRINKAVGGETYSGHMLGVATDVAADRATTTKAKIWAHRQDEEKHNVGLFKVYDWGFHIASPRGFKDHLFIG